MGEHTTISWTHHTMNPWWGCTEVSPACDNCYAREWARRFGVQWGAGQPRRPASERIWAEPLKWDRKAAKAGERRRVFCASMADVFDNEVDSQWRVDLFDLIRSTPNLDYLLLTKRVGNVMRMLRESLAAVEASLNETQAERGDRLSRDNNRRAGDRRSGSSLANEEENIRSMERRNEGHAMPAGTGGDRQTWELPASTRDDERGSLLRGSTPASLDTSERPNPAGSDRESRERNQAGQQAIESDAGDLQRAAPSRDSCSESETCRFSGIASSKNTSDGSGCSRDTKPAGRRKQGEGNSGTLPHHPERRLEYLLHEDVEARESLRRWLLDWIEGRPPLNVWLGATVVTQEEADRDVPKLLGIPAAIHFLSCEPLCGPIDLFDLPLTTSGERKAFLDPRDIDWVIAGGESGSKARPMHPAWVRSLRDQCARAGVAFHLKQWGAYLPNDQPEARGYAYDESSSHDWGDGIDSIHLHKSQSGRTLDGREWNEFPEVNHGN